MLEAALPARDRSMGEPRSYGSLDGTVYTHIDIASYNFYIRTKPEFNHRALCDAITQAEWWGMELLDEDECPAEMDEQGQTIIYLTPMVSADLVQPDRADRNGVRFHRGLSLVGGACMMIGLGTLASASIFTPFFGGMA